VSFLETFITELIGYHQIRTDGGQPATKRRAMNWIGPVSAHDNRATGELDLSLASNRGSDAILALNLAADVDDWSTGRVGQTELHITLPSPTTYGVKITGMVPPSTGASTELLVVNRTAQYAGADIIFVHNDLASTFGNRFQSVTGESVRIPGNGGAARLFYNASGTEWRVMRVI